MPKKPQKKSSQKDSGFDWQNDKGGMLLRLIKFGVVLGLWGLIFVGAVVAWYGAELPHIVKSTEFQKRASITIKAADGSVIARYGDLMGDTVDAKDVPDLVHAVVAIEDRRFYKHHGIDVEGLLRAIFVNLRSGELVQGGSTVTQQLAKNLFLTQERTIKRKIQEALLAVWLEHQMNKDEIMTAYLNRVYMGGGAYGAEAASQVYFNKSAKNLTLNESAILAGLLKAPSRYSPSNSPQQARERAQVVLKAMLEEGYITKKQYGRVATGGSVPVPQRKPTPGDTRKYYADWVMNELTDLIGAPDRDLIVTTTLWPSTQKAAEAAVNNVLETQGAARHATQSAVVMVDTDGAVRVMVGGRDYNMSQFNRATQALRQPGSSFKPFVYLAALENGWHPNDIIDDAPVSIGKYHPANFKNEYFGNVPLHFALAHSLNSAAIQLAQNVGPAKIVALAHNLGIHADLQPNLSLALGSYGVPVLEMVSAYASIANGGVGVDPYAILSVKDTDGTVLYQHRAKTVPLQVASYNAVQELAGMMQETIDEGTGVRARIPYLAAGKTGTSQDYRDAWFMGFSGPFATGVWVGNDDNSSMKAVTGGSLPADIWKQVMIAAYAEAPQRGLSTQARVQIGAAPEYSPEDAYNPSAITPDAIAPAGRDTAAPDAAQPPAYNAPGEDQQFIGGGALPPGDRQMPPQPDAPVPGEDTQYEDAAHEDGAAPQNTAKKSETPEKPETFDDVLHSLF